MNKNDKRFFIKFSQNEELIKTIKRSLSKFFNQVLSKKKKRESIKNWIRIFIKFSQKRKREKVSRMNKDLYQVLSKRRINKGSLSKFSQNQKSIKDIYQVHSKWKKRERILINLYQVLSKWRINKGSLSKFSQFLSKWKIFNQVLSKVKREKNPINDKESFIKFTEK